MEYKTLGTIILEMTGVIPEVEMSKALGSLLINKYELNGHFIYVKEPLRDRNCIITTRAYDPEGKELVKSILEELIEKQKRTEKYNLLKAHVAHVAYVDDFPY